MTVAQIAATEERRRSDRARAIERLASGVAHELGTPMNVISVRAELISELTESEEVVASAKVIKSQIETMATVIRRMLDFARGRPPRRERVDLVDLLGRLIDSVQTGAETRAIQFQLVHGPDSFFMEIDPTQIEQALRNLLINAIQAQPDGGKVSVTIDQVECRPRTEFGDDVSSVECARIQVKDDGVGISKEVLSHLFDPFFTTRRGEAIGLGLSVASCIVGDHGGWIDVDSKPNNGACFSVFLPLPAGN